MEKLDILGLPLKEGIELIKRNNTIDFNIEIKETLAWNKEKQGKLTEARILKALEYENKLTIIIGYF